jgi:hypothetical protein
MRRNRLRNVTSLDWKSMECILMDLSGSLVFEEYLKFILNDYIETT